MDAGFEQETSRSGMTVNESPEAVAGGVSVISPLVRRVTAPNPGMMTGPGTNCYLVGEKEVAVIDPGMDDAAHLERILEVAPGPIRWIVVTHTHPDHSPGSRSLAHRTGAPVLAHPRRLQSIRDENFRPDATLDEGDVLEGADFHLHCFYTPGHAADHICYFLEEDGTLFAGDHVMDGTTVVISPPDGDMQDYLESLARLQKEPLQHIAPGHGDIISDPQATLQGIIDHRLEREGQILALLEETGGATIAGLVERIYTAVPEALHGMARQSVYAHLLKLHREERVRGGEFEAIWRIRDQF